jgi:hypothetical protein
LDIDNVMLQFDQIEKKIAALIKVCKSFEVANKELTEKVKTLESALQQKIETENQYLEQKALIRSKIDGIMTRLDGLTDVKPE